MAKDLEKLEKQNKKLKKKNSAGAKVILFLLLIIVILLAVMFFLDPFGWGIGLNAAKSSGGGQNAPAAVVTGTAQPEATESTETDAPFVAKIQVTVSGSTYLMDGSETTAEKIVSAAVELDSDVLVEITDDNATQNAMEELKSALEKENIPYHINNKE